MSGDPFDTDTWRQYAQHATKSLLPKVRASAVSITLVPKGEPDIKFLLELGTVIWYNTPLILVVPEEKTLPEALIRAATAIVAGDITTEAGQALLREKLMQAEIG